MGDEPEALESAIALAAVLVSAFLLERAADGPDDGGGDQERDRVFMYTTYARATKPASSPMLVRAAATASRRISVRGEDISGSPRTHAAPKHIRQEAGARGRLPTCATFARN
ncbi:MAG: hypothetical protein WD004_05120 [Actinomycetota bacterium]